MKSRIISVFLAVTILLSANVQVLSENVSDSTADISTETTITEATAAPVITVAPETEESPDVTVVPAVTLKPAETVLPLVSVTPDVTATPKADKKDNIIRVSALEAGTTDLSQSLKDGTVTVDQSGSYTISDVTTTNAIVIKANTNVNLTLKDVSITAAATSPILIETGAVLTLTLEGVNTFNANAKYFPGIAVMATTTEHAKLFIEGEGQLDIHTTNAQSEGIGTIFTSANITPKSTGIHGEIIINSGILNINAEKSTAIGITTAKAVQNGYDIIINGGNITAKGYQTGIGASGSGSGAARNANIIINGGTVSASGSIRGIGGNNPNADNGTVTINGGNITATTTGTLSNSSGIQATNSITINGGNVTATGMGANSSGMNVLNPTDARIEINGGSIKATGINSITSGSGANIKTPDPVNKYDKPLVATDISIPGLGNAEVGLGAGKSITEADGSLRCYIPKNTKAFYVTHTNDEGKQVIYYTEDIFGENGNELKLYDGPPCSCDEDSLQAVIDLPSEIIVNRLAGQKIETLSAQLEHPNCTFPIHEYELYYELTLDDGSDVDSSMAYLDGNQLVIKYAAKGTTLRLQAVFAINDMEIRGVHDIQVQGDDISKFDLSKGNITISSDKLTNNPDWMSVTVSTPLENKQYILPRSDEVTIYQSSSVATSYNIRISVDASVVLDNINIQTNNSEVTRGYTLKLDDNLTATVSLKGDNKMLARQCQAIVANDTSNLIIKGEGSLNVTSNDGAAISGMDTLTINGGTVTAKGGQGGAGIGGDNHNINGINVVVNGGRVYATGSGNAAGIGGGDGGQGGSFIINGGMVKADSGSPTGNGIGDGGSPRNPGTITINGGSVNAVLPSRDGTYYNADLSYVNNPQYLLVIQPEGIKGQQNVTYTIDESAPIMTSTDSEGKLYLYPDKGQRWIRIYAEGKTYYRYLLVNADKTEKEMAVLNPVPKLKTFEIAGQIGETEINETNSTVSVTVPYNILLDSIKPIFTYDGALMSDNTTLDFNNNSHTAELTILGDDKNEKKYTITLTLAPAPSEPQAEVLDISKGSIWITDNYVTYAGVRYAVNPMGYIITGTAADNVIIVNNIDGGTIPPITLRDIHMTNNSSIPLRFNTAADITVEGECVINTNNNYALRCEQGEHGTTTVNITGEGKLFIQSASNSCYIDSQSTASINLPVTSIVSERKAADGNGKLIFGSDSYTKFSGKIDSSISTVNVADEPLYQLTAHLDTDSRVGNECTYNDKTYYLDDNNDICLMLTDGQYTMSVEYDNTQFDGTAEINGAPVNITLKTMKVDKVEYDNAQIPFTGKDIDFTITTSSVPEGTPVKVVLTPDREDAETLTADAIVGSDGRYTTTITIPENESTTERVRYTVSVFLDKKEFVQNLKLVVNVNNSVARITAFEIAGQIGETIISEENKTISMYFPYDHEFELVPNSNPKKYRVKPSKLEFIGSSIDHTVNDTVEFVQDVNGYLRSYYYVSSASGAQERYTVRLYYRPTPKITALRFNNTLTSAGGTVTVTATGQSTNYIQQSEKEENRKVYIYSEDGIEPVETKQVMVDNGAGAMVATFVADITVPENTDDTKAKTYVLKAKIGSTEQTAVGTLTVQRKEKNITAIKSFNIENQISSMISEFNTILVSMPYDADITNIQPDIELEDRNASYSPTDAQDFTNPVKYTVIAENGIDTREYTVNVVKQAEPVVTNIEFTNPTYSSAGRVQFKLNGQNLENSLNAVTENGGIIVQCTSSDGIYELSGEVKKNDNNEFIAIVDIPKNTDTIEKIYNVSVKVAGKIQNLTGNTILTVPAKELDSCELTDIILTEDQYPVVIQGTYVSFYLPYNTDLRSITPDVRHTGADYLPKGPQDFTKDIEYTIIAESGVTKKYTIHAMRGGVPSVIDIIAGNAGRLPSYAPKDVEIKMIGNFIPYLTDEDKANGKLNDTLTMTLTPKNGGDPITATIEYNTYGGEAIGHIAAIPPNETSEDVQYIVSVTLNGVAQDLGFSQTITVPCKKACAITEFIVRNQVGYSVINDISETESTITFSVPYEMEINSIEPEITIDADSITPTGAQNFEEPVEYIVSAEGMPDHKYTVTANRAGSPSVSSITMTESPETNKGGPVNVAVEGVFHKSIKVKAVPNDGSATIEGIVTMTEKHKASAVINIPANTSYSERIYTLVLNLDDYGDETYSDYVITLPKKTKRKSKKPTPTPTATAKPVTDPTAEPTAAPEPSVQPYMSGYEEGGDKLFKPDRNMTRAEVATILSKLDSSFDENTEYNGDLYDVMDGSWYANYMKFAVSKGYISGYDDGTYRPNNVITRAEFAAMIARYIDIEQLNGEDKFTDITEFNWCNKQINALADENIVSGYDDRTFKPANSITRAEAAAIINRALERKIPDEVMADIICPFADVSSAHWAYSDILTATQAY